MKVSLDRTGATPTVAAISATSKYYSSYVVIFDNAAKRLRAQGYDLELVRGVRGGRWTSYYKRTGYIPDNSTTEV
jgi:hypothetical protein